MVGRDLIVTCPNCLEKNYLDDCPRVPPKVRYQSQVPCVECGALRRAYMETALVKRRPKSEGDGSLAEKLEDRLLHRILCAACDHATSWNRDPNTARRKWRRGLLKPME